LNPTYPHTDAPQIGIFTDTVSRSISIEANDVYIDAEGEYFAADGSLAFVNVNGAKVSWQNVDAALKLLGVHALAPNWAADLPSDVLRELCAEQLRWLEDARAKEAAE
jgi:hypothetical protein